MIEDIVVVPGKVGVDQTIIEPRFHMNKRIVTLLCLRDGSMKEFCNNKDWLCKKPDEEVLILDIVLKRHR